LESPWGHLVEAIMRITSKKTPKTGVAIGTCPLSAPRKHNMLGNRPAAAHSAGNGRGSSAYKVPEDLDTALAIKALMRILLPVVTLAVDVASLGQHSHAHTAPEQH
jgi:hypothetical protein